MIVSSGHGWLTTLADLSIILFMVTAADLSNAQADPQPVSAGETAAVATADPVAIYRPQAGVIPFRAWLAAQPRDNRQRVTVLVRHHGADAGKQIASGYAFASKAEADRRSTRLIAEPGKRDEVIVMLTYDADPEQVAHTLLEAGREDPVDQSNLEKSR